MYIYSFSSNLTLPLSTASLNISCSTPCANYSDVFIDTDLFCDVLARDKHWDNIFGGSLVDIRRFGDPLLGYQSEPLLAFFHI